MKEVFEKRNDNRVTSNRYNLNLNIPRRNQVTFGTKSLKFYGLKIWNVLPVDIKTTENLNAFKDLIKKWNGVPSNCIVCTHHQFIFGYYNKDIIMYVKILIIVKCFIYVYFKKFRMIYLLLLLIFCRFRLALQINCNARLFISYNSCTFDRH